VFRPLLGGEVYLSPTPLRWTPSPPLRTNPRTPVFKVRTLIAFHPKTLYPKGGGPCCGQLVTHSGILRTLIPELRTPIHWSLRALGLGIRKPGSGLQKPGFALRKLGFRHQKLGFEDCWLLLQVAHHWQYLRPPSLESRPGSLAAKHRNMDNLDPGP
jgi:hypothetical protein